MNAQLRAGSTWLLVGAGAWGCLSSLDERNLDGEAEAGEGGGAGVTMTSGKGGTATNAGSGGSTMASGGESGAATQGGSAGSGSGATAGTSSGGTSGSGRGGDSGAQNGGAGAGTAGTSGTSGTTAESGTGGGGAGATAGSGGSDTAGVGSSGAAGTGGATGGSAGTGGGNVGGGGSGGTDGSPECGASFAAGLRGYVTSPGASGCWRGHAFVGIAGTGSTIVPASFDGCGQPCSLCIDGQVQGNETYSSFAMLGVNLNQALDSDARAAVVPEGQSLTLSYTNATNAPLRVNLDPPDGGVAWCYSLTEQGTVTIPYSSFRINCWDTSGVAYAGEPIVSISLVVAGGFSGTNQPYDVCLTGLEEG